MTRPGTAGKSPTKRINDEVFFAHKLLFRLGISFLVELRLGGSVQDRPPARSQSLVYPSHDR